MEDKRSVKKRGAYGKRKRNTLEDNDLQLEAFYPDTLSFHIPDIFTTENATPVHHGLHSDNENPGHSNNISNLDEESCKKKYTGEENTGHYEADDYLSQSFDIDRQADQLDTGSELNYEGSDCTNPTESDTSDDEGPRDNDLTLPSIDEDCSLTQNEDNSNVNIDLKPLYPGATITVGAFMLLIALFTSKYNVIGEGVQQLLNIIALALPNGHLLCKSLHAYKTFFRNIRNPLIFHYYCGQCLGYLESDKIAKCPVCNNNIDKTNQLYFIEMPVVNQIKNLFGQAGFYNSLQKRFSCSSNKNKFSDIYDGDLYKRMCENSGPLSYPQNISFVLNTDGAPVFKSSKVSIWPVFLVINELPYQQRMKKENMIMAALWFGSQKPAMSTFLKPLLTSLKELSVGVICTSPDIGEFICKGFLLAVTADLPARSMLCNSMQYNGEFGCWKCLQRDETAAVGKGHSHVFPYNSDLPKGPKRTVQGVVNDAKAAVRNRQNNVKKSAVNGVKGPSWLSFFPEFNIVDGMAIDYMHGVLSCVQKLLLTLWFMPKHRGSPYSFIEKVEVVDERLFFLQ